MITALPSRIMNYTVSAASPTDELLTLGRILSEVGDYASTILDHGHLSLSRKCGTRLDKVVRELISRQCIQSQENLYDMPLTEPSGADLSALTIGELYGQYCRWPIRHKERESEGREHFTFYQEGRIVSELQRRKATDQGELLKKDYCAVTYHNELENMSFVFSRPVQVDDDKIYPDRAMRYTFDELMALIGLYGGYRDIIEREILVEYVDYALDMLRLDTDALSNLGLLTEVAELGRRKIIRVPEWVNKKLEDAINDCASSKDSASSIVDSALAEAMLTLQMINGDISLTRKARRIIHLCYKSVFDESTELGERIENLHTAVTCCDYVTRFRVRRAAAVWNTVSSSALATVFSLTSKQIFRLLETAKELEGFAYISGELKNLLKQKLDWMAESDSVEAKAYKRFVELKF